MARFRTFDGLRWVAVACGIVGAPMALAAILLGNGIVAMVSVAFLGGFAVLIDRGNRKNAGARDG